MATAGVKCGYDGAKYGYSGGKVWLRRGQSVATARAKCGYSGGEVWLSGGKVWLRGGEGAKIGYRGGGAKCGYGGGGGRGQCVGLQRGLCVAIQYSGGDVWLQWGDVWLTRGEVWISERLFFYFFRQFRKMLSSTSLFYDIKLAEYLEVLEACLLWLLLSTPPAVLPSLISGIY